LLAAPHVSTFSHQQILIEPFSDEVSTWEAQKWEKKIFSLRCETETLSFLASILFIRVFCAEISKDFCKYNLSKM